MRPIVLFMVLAGFAAPAAAQPPKDGGMDAFFGATLVIDILGQWHAERTFRPDHTYTDVGADGTMQGTWQVADGKICTTPKVQLADRAKTYCNTGLGRTVGERWTDADPVTGATLFFELKPRPRG